MYPVRYRQYGFTLLEMLVALALGAVILYAALAAFRVASQSVTIANRLSLENSILRAGYQIAHHDLDFWTNIDDPDNSTRQYLRNGTAANGLPFTPFRTSWSAGPISDDEFAVGHDPRDTAWAVGNPRVWWRGNMAEKSISDLRFGRYAIFANGKATLSSGDLYDDSGSLYNAYGDPISVKHAWIYRQIADSWKAMGFYGMCDYLPANALYSYYLPCKNNGIDGPTNNGGIPLLMIAPSYRFNNMQFNNSDGNQVTTRSKYRNSYQTSYGIIDPRSSNDLRTLQHRHRRHYQLGYDSRINHQQEFNSWSAIPEDHLAQRPPSWPGLSVSVQRFIKNVRFVNIARINWTNPLNGQTSELSFSGFGTTLRGARQQRNPSGGWARWDNDGASIDPTLDDR